jgi:DNA-binding response OmpR family regulator
LTAKDTEDDALHGFGIGADDYVTKPFSIREVMARVKAVLSRSTSLPKSQPMNLVYEGLSVDLIKKTASVDGNVVELTKTELELLCLFLSHRGQVFSRQELIEKVWPQNVVVTSRTIDVNITRMRKKIGRYAACIVARQGYGYLFEA